MELTYDFPRGIDNTMRTAWDACQRKFLLAHIYNLRKTDPSMHLVFGGAYAKGLETARRLWYMGERDLPHILGTALIEIIREWHTELADPLLNEAKSLPNCLGALLYYFETWPLDRDWVEPTLINGKPAIEFSFALPIGVGHPESQDPILYTGRYDMLADFQGGLAIYDDKTATQLGASWVRGWDLDSQVTGYMWGAQQHGFRVDTAIIRGVSILKHQFGHSQAIQYRTKWHIESWTNLMHRNITDMIEAFQAGPDEFLPSYGQACKAFGGCPYRDLCDKENWEEWIEPDYQHYVWDPLKRIEVNHANTGS
jgi:hypothetical protein